MSGSHAAVALLCFVYSSNTLVCWPPGGTSVSVKAQHLVLRCQKIHCGPRPGSTGPVRQWPHVPSPSFPASGFCIEETNILQHFSFWTPNLTWLQFVSILWMRVYFVISDLAPWVSGTPEWMNDVVLYISRPLGWQVPWHLIDFVDWIPKPTTFKLEVEFRQMWTWLPNWNY